MIYRSKISSPDVILPVDPEPAHRVPDKPVVRDDPKLASGKIAFFQYLTVGVFVFLISGFWSIQVRNPEFYSERAESNRIKAVPIVAPRGKILDRDGRVIVDNHSSYSVLLARENLKTEHLRAIADGLNLDYNDLAARVNRFKSRPKYEPVVIKEELTPAELAFVEAHRDPEFFPEMEVFHSQKRLYPQNELAAHLVGYTGEVSDKELDAPEFAKYEQGDIVGKAGIERQYNDTLRGIDGQRRVVVDNLGHVRQETEMKEAKPGKNLQLTIDLDLQVVAELAMEDRMGALVALDPRNGEILAMVSRPAYDPNKFAVRIQTADWKNLTSNPDNPLLNRAIQAQLAPGSTFKPLMALAGLESEAIDDSFTVHCGGGATFYGHFHKCWSTHGGISLHRGIVQSCDVFFYNVGNRMGIDKIAFYAEQAGFGHRTGVDLPNEAEGIVPSSQWKIRNYRQKWYAGETISVSIGQGALTITPIQLASAVGGIAMGGVWYKPHLVKGHEEPPRKYALDPENVQKVVDGMYGVVNEGGTGVRAQLKGIEICGKTGSAQTASNAYAKSHKGAALDNSWFVGFGQRNNPEIVIAVLWQNAEHGMLSAPIVRDVLKAYYDKKARLGIANTPGIARTARPVGQVPGLPSATGADKVKPAIPTART
jgi:penicillin-binding protein 2